MNNKIKENIVKLSIVISGILLISFVMFPIVCVVLGYNFEQSEKVWIVIGIATFISGTVMVVLMCFMKLTPEITKPDKALLMFETYDKLKVSLDEELIQRQYFKIKEISSYKNVEIIIYIKSQRLWVFDCFAIIKTSELSDEIVNNANDSITECFKEYYNKNTVTNTVNMISLLCVDRITPTFRKMVNMNIQQGIKNGRFVAGASFGGKIIYIANQIDGYALGKYRRLRNEFCDIMNID